jgi:hypothetical protein
MGIASKKNCPSNPLGNQSPELIAFSPSISYLSIMVLTRKSNRARVATSKAKQLQETLKKPVLRSISTIDENENTYNNVNFKRRRLDQPMQQEQIEEVQSSLQYNSKIDDDEEEDYFQSEEDNMFNSDDDEYYSALSDYESDSKSRFLSFKRLHQEEDIHRHITLSQSQLLEDNLFDTSESEPDSPISPVSSIVHTFSELKSLEENFQKIIDENNKMENTTVAHPVTTSSSPAQSFQEQLTVEDFLNYNPAPVESEQNLQSATPKQKFLQYRHDERHNLAFPDVSTFPVRFDPTNVKSSMKKKVRALNRRAILSGKASEMVGTGLTMGDWMF